MKISQLLLNDDLVSSSPHEHTLPSPAPSHIAVTSPPSRTNTWSPLTSPVYPSSASKRTQPYVRCLISTSFDAVPSVRIVTESSNICQHCFKQFPKPHFLQAHMAAHATVLAYGCGCGQRFKRLQDLRRHVKTQGHSTEQ
ncbi:hypothetical protein BJ741DRAFT_672666 [Chytriomyces cf. hyalinus JEL632]|nr:hypothetical protein BJ741DRAFT_672666 [Chytriomyces cf. hyalinus JEL632]